MATKIYVNLPVKDLNRSVAFFTALGFGFDPRYTDATATCMVVTDAIHVMLLTEAKFMSFTPKQICDTAKSTEVLLALSTDSRDAVDALVGKALAAGATTFSEPHEYGFMYGHGFQDLDGHIWELFHTTPTAH